jgi:hypothetical protein
MNADLQQFLIGTALIASGFICLVSLIAIIILVIRKRWQAQAVFGLVILGALVAGYIALIMVTEGSNSSSDKMAGAVLLGIALLALLATAIALKVLYFSVAPAKKRDAGLFRSMRGDDCGGGELSTGITAQRQL